MKITLLGAEVGSKTSGESRFLINLAVGLRNEGVDVSIAATAVHPEAMATLRAQGVTVFALGPFTERGASKALLLTTRSHVGRDVARRAVVEVPGDWYVVVSDAAVDASMYLPRGQSAYISNGDLGLMLLSDSFYSTHRLSKSLLALGTSRLIRRNAAFAQRYEVLVANSEFSRGLMSYLYSTPFQAVVYPPVDCSTFYPETCGQSVDSYVLAMTRNSNEQGLPLLEKLAELTDLHVVGGANIRGAQSLGVVSDSHLRREYSQALFTIIPVVSEPFGYAVAESLACGTPVLAFNSCGPAEQIQDSQSGWLVSTHAEALAKASSLIRTGVPLEMRISARKRSERFSMRESAQGLIRVLRRI